MFQRFCLVSLTISNRKTSYRSLKQTPGLTNCPWTTILVSSNGPRIQDDPRQGVLGSPIEVHRKIFKNLLQIYLAQMLEIWYMALPGDPLRVQEPRWPRARGPRFQP